MRDDERIEGGPAGGASPRPRPAPPNEDARPGLLERSPAGRVNSSFLDRPAQAVGWQRHEIFAPYREPGPAAPTSGLGGAARTVAATPDAMPPPVPRGTGRIKAAFFTPTLLMGGAEHWMISLARCCDPHRIEWTGTSLSARAPAHAELCREMSAFMPVHAGPGAGPPCGSYVIRHQSARAALEAALDDADMLITWGLPHLAKLVEGYDRPIIFVSHGAGEWSIRTVRSSESGATHCVAVSESALAPFSDEVRKAATIIHNGIDVERCTPTASRRQTRAAWGFEDHHRLIGYVGRYSREKNPSAAARAAARLGGDYYAVYAGDGWMEAELRRHVGRIAGPRARFVPRDRQVGNPLSAVDVFVLASPSEGFSLSLAEAWYCGVPVVATRVGAVPELERVHGPLVAPVPTDPTAEELARAIELALTPGFRAEVVERAQEVVSRHYTARTMARRWTEYLGSIGGPLPAVRRWP